MKFKIVLMKWFCSVYLSIFFLASGVFKSSSKALNDSKEVKNATSSLLPDPWTYQSSIVLSQFSSKDSVVDINGLLALSKIIDDAETVKKLEGNMNNDEKHLLEAVQKDVDKCALEFDIKKSNRHYNECLKKKLFRYDSMRLDKLITRFVSVYYPTYKLDIRR